MCLKLAATLLLFACAGFAQVVAGTAEISGVVKDPSGSSVPNAKVVISSTGQGTLRTLTTNAGGAFTAPALTPGPGYKLTVTAAGFNTYEADHLILTVGQNLSLPVSLVVGSAVTEVEVAATATMVEDTKSDVSTAVDSRAIQDLP